MEEGKQTRLRLELARVTPAAVLRQQVYRFVPTDLNPNPAGPIAGLAMPPLGAEANMALGMPNGILGMSPLASNPQGPSFAQHVQQQKKAKGVPNGSAKHHADHPSQDVLLRELFPGEMYPVCLYFLLF